MPIRPPRPERTLDVPGTRPPSPELERKRRNRLVPEFERARPPIPELERTLPTGVRVPPPERVLDKPNLRPPPPERKL